MLRSRASTVWFLAWAGLLLIAFRPPSGVQRVLDLALAPRRLAAGLARPLELLQGRSVRAAERALAASARQEAEEGAELLTRLARRALPSDPELVRGRRFVSGEVLERPDADHAWIAVGDLAGIEPEAPVVCGDLYVGRVVERWPGTSGPGRVRVELLTARTFRVGASVRSDEDETFLTVGGLLARPRARGVPAARRTVLLAAHQPSSSRLGGGLARVHELFAEASGVAELAEGFRLGTVRCDDARGPWWVEPELDFLDGLFQVAVVTRDSPGLPSVPPFEPALTDGRWLATRALTSGDPSPWRSTLKLPLGRASGLRPGAAVTGAGARLIGRVLGVGAATSDVALLPDPGFSLTAVASLEGEPEPVILGRLTSLGRDEGGRLRLSWSVQVALGHDPARPAGDQRPRRARIYTGSGDPGLPGGLFLGETFLPPTAAAGEQVELILPLPIDPGDLRRLFVRHAPDPEPAP